MARSQADQARVIAGLIAKAEGTNNAEEAESFLAKAQELMTRWAVDEAILDGARETEDNPLDTTIIRLTYPYANMRAVLLDAVAEANNCRIVLLQGNQVQVIGFRRDIERTELLYTALSTHAATEMLRGGAGNAQSFRRSFLLMFGVRIRERFEEIKAAVEAAVEPGTALVLFDRSQLVEDRVSEMFPHLTRRTIKATSAAGAEAGRTAANRADLGQTRVGGQGEIR